MQVLCSCSATQAHAPVHVMQIRQCIAGVMDGCKHAAASMQPHRCTHAAVQDRPLAGMRYHCTSSTPSVTCESLHICVPPPRADLDELGTFTSSGASSMSEQPSQRVTKRPYPRPSSHPDRRATPREVRRSPPTPPTLWVQHQCSAVPVPVTDRAVRHSSPHLGHSFTHIAYRASAGPTRGLAVQLSGSSPRERVLNAEMHCVEHQDSPLQVMPRVGSTTSSLSSQSAFNSTRASGKVRHTTSKQTLSRLPPGA